MGLSDDAVIDDVNLWLEQVEGHEALDWVRARNAVAEAELFADPRFDGLRTEILGLLEAEDRVPIPSRHGDWVLNFWTDSRHRRGVLRRASWDAFRAGAEQWEELLDVDELGRQEGESWVYAGSVARRPDRRRLLIDLSPGGSDASVTREFDLVDRKFVPPTEDGFYRPLSKGWLVWVDEDTVYVGHDFGAGTMTSSGYPRTIRRWQRGTPLDQAPVVFEAEESDVTAAVSVATLPGHRHQLFERAIDFYRSRKWLWRDGSLVPLDVPDDANVDLHERWLVVRPRTDWTIGGQLHPAGSLVVTELNRYLAGEQELRRIFTPSTTTSLSGWGWTRSRLLLTVQEDVKDHLEVLDPATDWSSEPLAGAPTTWSANAWPCDSDTSEDCFVLGQDFLHPSTLFFVSAGPSSAAERLRSVPDRFDTAGLGMQQRFATSADGTRVPYFLVGPAEDLDGARPGPTLLSGYGGFEISNTASYAGAVGRAWLSAGGRYALANIRGGGEYGPSWHEAALRENRHRAYEDFEAVARDLIDAKVTTPDQLGIMGGSNGGLLVGNMYVRSPELFGAVVCQVPLLDMKRYSHLLAGASWMAEYGDPDDPTDWEFIRTFSPYHLVEAGRAYPPILLMTSTRDDRVHPGHARKMAARLIDLGYDVTYWENMEGGHAGAADAPQQATMSALSYTFLRRRLALA